ncbi:unnamed protein product [Brachionus calyciflorus]|uniref:Uncharacterized protein n=1 Tax=Brachionus calyciflorus TaxID=104777 RepID=A0A813U908_9BILA|nr:unnamed protein product [Brachionus calyciflorus]
MHALRGKVRPDEEKFNDALEPEVTDLNFIDILKASTKSININKSLKSQETLKSSSQNVKSWFEKFELLTTRWSKEEKGLEVVGFFEDIALQKYQLLTEEKFNYDKIKQHMLKELRPNFSPFNLIAEFFRAKKPEETIDRFALC